LKGVVIILFALLCAAIPGPAQAESFTINEPAKYIIADDPAHADPDFDDSGWREKPFATMPSWSDLGGGPGDFIRWDRVRFSLPDGFDLTSPAFVIPGVLGADEVFLNGVKIGATNLADPFRPDFPAISNKVWPRVYLFDPALLKTEAPNLLAIRFGRWGTHDAGVFDGPVELAAFGAAQVKVADRTLTYLPWSFVVTAVNVANILVLGLCLLLGYSSRAVFMIFLVTLANLPIAVLGSTLVLRFEMQVHPLAHLYALKVSILAIIPFIEFASAALRRKVGRLGRLAQILTVLVFAIPPLKDPAYSALLAVFNYSWLIISACAVLLLIWWAMMSARRAEGEGLAFLLALLALLAGVVSELLGMGKATMAATGHPVLDLAVTCTFIFLSVMALVAHRNMSRRLARAQAFVLTAHEAERGRLSRDVHDGVGQWLTTIKLGLEMKQADGAGDLQDVVSQVDQAIDDTRRISHDLSPAIFANQSMLAAMRSHAAEVNRRTGARIEILADVDRELAGDAKTHVFRIYQEAVSNAFRHGRATEITVTLAIDATGLGLDIEDNGAGLRHDHKPGLGFTSMSERAAILQGDLIIGAGPEKGVLVRLTCPPPKEIAGRVDREN